ncbi:MAG TPA: hypoxanthine-guanine phosphoribosyltransferase [Usitatibacteraceae bacterium]|nr:hypoxanthine-guanine phosphoribosyltransferase [Usitatibacteraceae bacterium]
MNATEARAFLADSEILFSAEAVNAATARVAAELNRDYQDRNPLVLGVMGGAVVFAGQLLPLLEFPLEFDIVSASRYGDKTVGTHINWRVTPRENVSGRHVLLVDDILDEGITLAAIVDLLKSQGAASVECAVFCQKDYGAAVNAKKPLAARYVGLTVPNRFIFGYGMDVAGAWRNLPAIWAKRGA